MTIVGFDFTKIDAEKKAAPKGKININNNVAIKKVEEKELKIASDDRNALKFIFEFIASYDPSVGHIKLTGELIYMDEVKKIKDTLAGWKKDKKLDKELSQSILNTILTKSNIQALFLSQYLNLPPPIPLPKVQAEGAKK